MDELKKVELCGTSQFLCHISYAPMLSGDSRRIPGTGAKILTIPSLCLISVSLPSTWLPPSVEVTPPPVVKDLAAVRSNALM